jgi:hypothetical protein
MSDAKVARLRGGLSIGLDSRTIEYAARSSCQRYRVMAASGAGAKAIGQAIGYQMPPVSRVAENLGMLFENRVYEDQASVLRSCYVVDAPSVEETVDVRILVSTNANEHTHKSRAASAEIIQEETRRYVTKRIETGDGKRLIIGPRLEFPTPGGVAHAMPDFLVVPKGSKRFRVGEVKSYLDLGSRTDPNEIGTAVRQAAVSVIAFQLAFGEEWVEDKVDIVFRESSKRGASVHTMDASIEVASIKEFLDSTMPEEAGAAAALLGGAPLTDVEALQAIPHRWEPSCIQHCPLEPLCHERAAAADSLELLGPSASAMLEGLSSLSRVRDLAVGRASTDTVDEERVTGDLRLGWMASAMLEGDGR